MIMVRSRDVDHVQRWVGGQVLVRSVRPGEAKLAGEALGSIESAGSDCGELGFVGQQGKVAGEGRGDLTGTEDSPANAAGFADHRPIQPHRNRLVE